MNSKIASSEWAVLNLIEHGLINDNFDGHPGPDDIPIEENQAIWVKCTGS